MNNVNFIKVSFFLWCQASTQLTELGLKNSFMLVFGSSKNDQKEQSILYKSWCENNYIMLGFEQQLEEKGSITENEQTVPETSM